MFHENVIQFKKYINWLFLQNFIQKNCDLARNCVKLHSNYKALQIITKR
jgi:hypothetical protein